MVGVLLSSSTGFIGGGGAGNRASFPCYSQNKVHRALGISTGRTQAPVRGEEAGCRWIHAEPSVPADSSEGRPVLRKAEQDQIQPGVRELTG